MARVLTAKRRTENEIEFGRIVAFSDGVFAIAIGFIVLIPFSSELLGEYGGRRRHWSSTRLVLFVDPSRRLAGRGSAPDDEGDRLAGPRAGD